MFQDPNSKAPAFSPSFVFYPHTPFENISSALCTAKALLSREGSNDHVLVLLKASPSEVQALLEPFTARLAQMNTARMSARVWSGLFGRARSGGRGDGGSRGVADIARAERSAMSAEVWTTEGKESYFVSAALGTVFCRCARARNNV